MGWDVSVGGSEVVVGQRKMQRTGDGFEGAVESVAGAQMEAGAWMVLKINGGMQVASILGEPGQEVCGIWSVVVLVDKVEV